MRDDAFWKNAPAPRGHGRGVRSGGGGRRHQRPDGRACLPQGAARRPRPGPRQPRRLRRPRQAQRVHPQRPHLHRLRRHAVHRQPGALQQGGQGAHLRAGHRGLALSEGARLGSLQVARPPLRVLLRQGNLRHRSPAGRRHPRRCVPGRGAGERRGAARSQAAADRALRPDAGPQPVREEGAPRAHELRGLPHQDVEARPRRAAALPDAPTRAVRRRHRCRAGAGRLRLRLSRVRRDGHGFDSWPGPELRLDSQQGSGGLLLPFPRRQCVGRAAPRASARTRRPLRLDDGRHRDGAGRLRQARRRRSAGANPREQLRDARAAHRAGRRRPARRSGVPAQRHEDPQDGQGAFGRPGVLALDHSVPVSRAARRAEDGARVRHQGAARLHERVHPIVEGLSEAGRPAHLDSGDVAHLGGPGFPGEPRRLQVPDRSRRTNRAAPVEGGVPSGPAGARPTPRGPG